MAVTTDRFPQWLISEYNGYYSQLPQQLKTLATVARGTFNAAILKSVDQDSSGAWGRIANGKMKVAEYQQNMYQYGNAAQSMFGTLIKMQNHAEKVVSNNLSASSETKAAMQRSEAAATAAYAPPGEQSDSTWWTAIKQMGADVLAGDPLRSKREQNMSMTEIFDPDVMDYAATGSQKAAVDMGKKLRGEDCYLLDVKCQLKKNKWTVIGVGVGVAAVLGLVVYIMLAPRDAIEIRVT